MSDYNREREFIRQHFMAGTLDVGSSFETMKQFAELMAGEMEALVAIDQASWLSESQMRMLLKVAKPTSETVRELKAWKAGIFKPRPRRRKVA